MATTTIKLRNIASYSPTNEISLVLTKPVVVFYGHNGVGKSTIARVIRNHSNTSQVGGDSCSVSVAGIADPEFFVYDLDYVEENFHPKEGKGIKGIFTLGKKTAEDLVEVKSQETVVEALDVKIESVRSSLSQLESSNAAAFSSAKDGTWDIKSTFEQGPLRFCLEKHKLRADKGKLFQHLASVANADASISIEDLLQEASEIQEEVADAKQSLAIPEYHLGEIEQDNLLGSSIAASTNSRLSELVAKLKNESWVQRGQEFLPNADGACPFCQQEMPHDFLEEIAKLFDKEYATQCERITALRDRYRVEVDALVDLYESAPFQDDYVKSDMNLENAWKNLLILMEHNARELEKKASNPGDPVTLKDSSSAFSTWTERIKSAATRIADYNQRIANRSKVQNDIDDRFWKLMRHQYAATLTHYKTTIADNTEKAEAATKTLQALNADRLAAHQRIMELRKSATNIDSSIDAINQRIQNIGIRGFRIQRDDNNDGYYHIARGKQGKIEYKSLSEGERNLVTFLYFVESLGGSHTSDGASNKAKRIIVIDDPISSLSHNHVYDIASLITTSLIEADTFPQIIILTHSLFFYHELFKAIDPKRVKHCQCFRVTKNEFSEIHEMSHDDIKNDYQSYWLILKEAAQSHKYSVAIPIAMRYILEHYFGFIGYHDKLRKALLGLGNSDKPFFAFYRYINRQSHSDEVNISDLPAIDPTIYVAKFRQVFELTGHLRHYDHMMGIEKMDNEPQPG